MFYLVILVLLLVLLWLLLRGFGGGGGGGGWWDGPDVPDDPSGIEALPPFDREHADRR